MKLKRFSSIVPKMKSKYFSVLIGLLLLVIVLLFVNMRMFNTYEGFNVTTYSSTNLNIRTYGYAITKDGYGHIYVPAFVNNKCIINKITPSGTVVYNTNSIDPPSSMAVDRAGTLYFFNGNHYNIYKMLPSGAATRYAGPPDDSSNMSYGYSGRRPPSLGYVNGPALSAKFSVISGMVFDTLGNLYLCDSGNMCIRKIALNGPAITVTTHAGALPEVSISTRLGNVDGPALTARFGGPRGIAIDHNNELYVADSHYKSIRKITTTGEVSTIARDLGFNPTGITVDPRKNLYLVDSQNNNITMLAFPSYTKTIMTSAGTSGWSYPVGITRDNLGIFYITATTSGLISVWKLSASCTAGNYLTNGFCTPCFKGSWSAAGASVCTRCPSNQTTSSTGSTSASQCIVQSTAAQPTPAQPTPAQPTPVQPTPVQTTCFAGFFKQNNTCATCPVGTWSASINSSACTPCERGKTTNGAASTSASACSLVASGFYMNGMTITPCPSNGTCYGGVISQGRGGVMSPSFTCAPGFRKTLTQCIR